MSVRHALGFPGSAEWFGAAGPGAGGAAPVGGFACKIFAGIELHLRRSGTGPGGLWDR
jgi:hypothetical protein